MQLSEIMQSVQRTLNRYTVDVTLHPGKKIAYAEFKRRRMNLLEKIADYANSVEIKENILVHILAWLEEWSKFSKVVQRKTTKLMKKLENRIYKEILKD